MRHASLLLILSFAACDPAGPGKDLHAWDPNRVARSITSADGDVGAVVDGNDAFTWDLYGQLATEEENLFFSPISISAALGMTTAGAGGDTLTQMQDVLHLSIPAEQWHPAFGALIDDLNGDKLRGYRLEVANRLFGQDGTAWAADFLATCNDDWHAPMQSVDFAGDPEGSRGVVNGWVSDQTQQHIPELIPQGVITPDTRLVLANAIYFLADWWTQFDTTETKAGSFTRLDGSTVTTDMMWLDLSKVEDSRVRSTEINGAAIVRMPYEDDEVAAYLVIPSAADGLLGLEAQLNQDTFREWVAPIEGAYSEDRDEEGMVAIPKLELRWKGSLVPALQALGMTDAFDPLLADFSPMADGDAASDYMISDVIHEAWVRVDEAGTEAAAATAVVITDTAAPIPRIADHPFLIVVRDDLTGSLLFVARVMDPAAG